jgi:hypothetical protein
MPSCSTLLECRVSRSERSRESTREQHDGGSSTQGWRVAGSRTSRTASQESTAREGNKRREGGGWRAHVFLPGAVDSPGALVVIRRWRPRRTAAGRAAARFSRYGLGPPAASRRYLVADGRACGPGVRVRTWTLPPHDELEGYWPLDGQRSLIVTSSRRENIILGVIRATAPHDSSSGTHLYMNLSVFDRPPGALG